MTITVDRKTLARLIACAAAHIDDVETGIRDGHYEASDNVDLADKKEALRAAQILIEPPERPRGGYFIMIDREQTVDHCDTLTQARARGLVLCDAETLPCNFGIHDAAGEFIEAIERTDGKDLETLIKEFPAYKR